MEEGPGMSGFTVLLIVLGSTTAFALLLLWYRSMMHKVTALWAPNTQLVQGTFSRWRALLRGTYQGHAVAAYLANEGGDDDTASKTYGYIVHLTFPPGFENWSAICQVARKGEAPAWRVKVKPGPADRLTAAGLLAALDHAPKNYQFRYRASTGRMQLLIPRVGMYFCPDTRTFQAQLELLSRLAAITQAAAQPDIRQAAA